jgi:hypothetical protein
MFHAKCCAFLEYRLLHGADNVENFTLHEITLIFCSAETVLGADELNMSTIRM